MGPSRTTVTSNLLVSCSWYLTHSCQRKQNGEGDGASHNTLWAGVGKEGAGHGRRTGK